jgi:hypothetical protein
MSSLSPIGRGPSCGILRDSVNRDARHFSHSGLGKTCLPGVYGGKLPIWRMRGMDYARSLNMGPPRPKPTGTPGSPRWPVWTERLANSRVRWRPCIDSMPSGMGMTRAGFPDCLAVGTPGAPALAAAVLGCRIFPRAPAPSLMPYLPFHGHTLRLRRGVWAFCGGIMPIALADDQGLDGSHFSQTYAKMN